MKKLREDGWEAEKVEQTIPKTYIKRDLFNCIDIVAIREGMTLGVQATSIAHIRDHIEKHNKEPLLYLWLKAKNRFQIWGWAKQGKRGERKTFRLKKFEVRLRWTNYFLEWHECSTS